MTQQINIFTADAGRSSTHMALYRYEIGSRATPEKIKDYRDVKNIDYMSHATGLQTERIDETVGIVRQAIHDLPAEVKANLGAVVADSHGAAGHILDKAGNPLFHQVYDHKYDGTGVRTRLHAMCGTQTALYEETGTPRLSKGINWSVQLLGHLENDFDVMQHAGSVTSVAGYLIGRLLDTSVPTDWTHIANHGYAADVRGAQLRYSSVLAALKEIYSFDVHRLLRDARREAYLPVGEFKENNEFGVAKGARGFSIAHDTSLVAELARMGGFTSFDNSGTWSCPMSPGRRPKVQPHMRQWDFTVNADIYGKHLPTAMFRGGQMWEGYMNEAGLDKGFDTSFDMQLFMEILSLGTYIRPAFMDGFGPYKHKTTTPVVDSDLLANPAKLAHAVQLSLALQTVFAEAAATRDLPKDTSIVDLLEHPKGDKMLLAGVARKGLSGAVLGAVMPKDIYTVEDSTPVNLTGALVAAAFFEGVRPDELNPSGLPIRKAEQIRLEGQLKAMLIEYARGYEQWVRSMPN